MYNHNLIEKKWQKYWDENHTFKFVDSKEGKKFYVLDMFPYPSGNGLHVGHPKGYTATDIISRYKRLQGFDVLHPIGWDAFGLPAEQYAIKTNNHPRHFTEKNIKNFRNQLKKIGFDYDYEKEVNTSDPKYYKWTQWIFTKLFENGLAEIKDIDVNWCEELKTTLSNEEVLLDKNGNQVSEVGGFPVTRKPMRQWVLKITKYADKLLSGLDEVDWPESLKSLQRNWIGKMIGIEFNLEVDGLSNESIKVFTTRLDTIYGVSFICLNPKHSFVKKNIKDKKILDFVDSYLAKSARKVAIDNEKNGIFTGYYAINPINGKKIPIWLGDYILENVGTGAIMGVPAHDERDYEFAKKYNLEIIKVIDSDKLPFNHDGKHINSNLINGLNIEESINKIKDYFKSNKINFEDKTFYKLKDWVFSRQRYWGEPFPILFDENDKIIIDENLPILLPEIDDFKPGSDGQSPLSKCQNFIKVEIKNKKYHRDSNTMPQWAGSCWYYLAYILKNDNGTYIDLNSKEAFEKFKKWLPVDIYIGGQEHAVLHLLYARFWHHFLYDIGIVPNKEPFKKIINQGMILGSNGEKMSKSKGNIINPDEIIEAYGADSLRLYEAFMGPLTATLPWSDQGINGVRKWLDRVYRYFIEVEKEIIDLAELKDDELIFNYNLFIKNVTHNIENNFFNLAISDMMIFINQLYKVKVVAKQYLKNFLVVLSCFAPHLSEELWTTFDQNKSVCLQKWPTYNEELLIKDVVNIGFLINGKPKKRFDVAKDLNDDELCDLIEKDEKVIELLKNKKIIKKIIIKNKVANYLIKESE